jgi:hypothetical protein
MTNQLYPNPLLKKKKDFLGGVDRQQQTEISLSLQNLGKVKEF